MTAKLCTRCGLPLPDGYRGGRHFDPDECVRLLVARDAEKQREIDRLRNTIIAISRLSDELSELEHVR